MTQLRNLVLLLAAMFLGSSLSAHATMRLPAEPTTPTGSYNLTPMPTGTTCTVVVVPGPFCGPNGPWIGYVFLNGDLVGPETMVLIRSSSGGYVWENSKVGPRSGVNGGGTLKWNTDHYESEVTQGDNTGTKRTWTPQ